MSKESYVTSADIATITQIAKSIQDDIDAILPIADIPTTLAMEAHEQWKTVRHTQLIERLRDFRIKVEAEAKTGLVNIETNLGLALANIAEELGIKDRADLLKVLGPAAYLAMYDADPVLPPA